MPSRFTSRIDPVRWTARLVSRLRRLRFEGLGHIPRQGAAMIATTHSTPMDFFYVLALMEHIGRQDYRAVVAAELLDRQQFWSYTRAALENEASWLTPFAGLAAGFMSRVVPAVVRRVNPIPVYRKGDDSASRRQSLQSLLAGELLVIAPGAGNNRDRDADGLRPLTFGVASIARRYFEATAEALAVIPLAIYPPAGSIRVQLTLRIGEPFRGMTDQEYPQLFLRAGAIEERSKQQAYQLYTQQLASKLTELLQRPPR